MAVPAQATNPSTNYEMIQDKLVAQAPILQANGQFTPTYLTDCATIWEKLSDLTCKHDCWTCVHPARTRDGRLGYNGLEGHYLGVNNVDNMST